MRVVLDTNVVVSALLAPRGIPAAVLKGVLDRDLALVLDGRILAEYEEVLVRPRLEIDPVDAAFFLEFVRARGVFVARAAPLGVSIPDPDDAPFLEVARSALVDALVTGNVAHFPAAAWGGVRVLSPREFSEVWRRAREKRKQGGAP